MAAAGWLGAWLAVLCWPVLAGRGARLLGDELGHAWRALWTTEQVRTQLGAGAGWPLSTQSLGAPFGGSYASPAPLFDLISAALRAVLGPVSAFDVAAIGHLGLAAGGAWALGRLAGLRWEGALIAASVFAFNALLLSAGAASGAPEVLGMAWVPWALAAGLWVTRAPGPISALALALSVIAVSLADLHLALFAPLLLPLVVAPALVERRWGEGVGAWVRALGWVALGVAGAALVVGPILGPMLSALADPYAIAPPGSLRLVPLLAPDELGGAVASFATLSDVLLPGGELAEVRGAALTMRSVYAGWVALVLAGVGAGLGRLRWVTLAVVALILAMGPYLLITPDGWRPVPVGWWTWLRETWPVYRLVTSPVHAMSFAFAGLAVLAGFGMDRLMVVLSATRLTAVAPWALSGAIIVEILGLTPIPTQLPSAEVWIPGAVTEVRGVGPGAVLDWPPREASGRSEISRYASYQMWHQRPVFFDLSSEPGDAGVESNPFFVALERASYGDGYRSPQWSKVSALPLGLGVEALSHMGFAWLIYHPWHVAPDRREAVESLLSSALVLHLEHPDGSRLYRIAPPRE